MTWQYRITTGVFTNFAAGLEKEKLSDLSVIRHDCPQKQVPDGLLLMLSAEVPHVGIDVDHRPSASHAYIKPKHMTWQW